MWSFAEAHHKTRSFVFGFFLCHYCVVVISFSLLHFENMLSCWFRKWSDTSYPIIFTWVLAFTSDTQGLYDALNSNNTMVARGDTLAFYCVLQLVNSCSNTFLMETFFHFFHSFLDVVCFFGWIYGTFYSILIRIVAKLLVKLFNV